MAGRLRANHAFSAAKLATGQETKPPDLCTISWETLSNWSFDILRQSGLGLWAWVCIGATAVLLAYALLGQIWKSSARAKTSIAGVIFGLAGTSLVLSIPSLRQPLPGMVWTWLLMVDLSLVFYLNLRQILSPRRTAILMALRVLALTLLVPMLFEPVITFVTRPPADRPLIFLVDASGSMSVSDAPNTPTRFQSVWQAIQPQLPKVDETFAPAFFTFSSGINPLEHPQDLSRVTPDGQSTDLVDAITAALATTSRPDATVILISDGIDNTSPDIARALQGISHPVHTLSVGSEQAEPSTLPNVAVDNVQAASELTVGQTSKITATIKSTALANRIVQVRLAPIDAEGKPTAAEVSQSLVLQPLAQGQTIDLPFTPPKVGIQRLAIWIDPIPGERSTIDNRQEFQDLAMDARIKVLYIEGRVRPEYRDLNRALSRDASIEPATLLRIQEDRFAASGTVDAQPFTRMPQSVEDFKKFDVLILGDMDVASFSSAQQQAIEKAVSDGTGLLMIGGQSSFGPGGYAGTPIGRVLPVEMAGRSQGQDSDPFVPRLTDAGHVHPAMADLLPYFGLNAKAAEKPIPPLRGNVIVSGAKAGAQILLTHPGQRGPDGKDQIVLAVQPYGKGRSAAFTADTTYLWYLPMRGMGQDSPYNRFWGQLLRWLANTDTRNRQKGPGVEAMLNKNIFQLRENVQLRALVTDQRGDATRYAQVTVTLTRTSTDPAHPVAGTPSATGPSSQQLSLDPMETHTGLYQATLNSPAQGQWTAEIVARKDNTVLGRQTIRFSVIPPADEMLRLAATPNVLATISQTTAGYTYPLAQLPALIEQIIRSDPAAGKTIQRTIPLANTPRTLLALTGRTPTWPAKYDLPFQACLVITLLGAEWFTRRYWQLP